MNILFQIKLYELIESDLIPAGNSKKKTKPFFHFKKKSIEYQDNVS